jgi:hypothetical protein
MRFNDRAMALAGIPDLPVDAFKKEGGKIKLHGGGGPTTTKSETSNIPEYARPYVERMLGSTEKQVYTYGPSGNITGFQPYKPFQGETVAGFSPMQGQAMRGIQNYRLPGQTGMATDLTNVGTMASMGAGQQYQQQATNPYATQAYMSPYMEGALQPQMREAARQSAIQKQTNLAEASKQGAFGGSRQALIEAERQRNLAQQQADIYGKGMQSAFEQARQAQQFGAELGLKGYGQAMQGAEQIGKLGQQQYGQEMGLLGQQMDVGGKQQAYEQARLNQIIQDYATAQQYPFIQLGTLSNMLRGLPMQASTTQLYQAQPPLLQQGIGLAGAYANLKQAGAIGSKEGGAIKEMASGGIASGADPYKLPSMMKKLSDDQLQGKLGGDTDPETMGIAQAEKQRRDQVRAGAPKMMAGGGAVAFAKGGMKDEVYNPFNTVEPKQDNKTEFKEVKTVKKQVSAPKKEVKQEPPVPKETAPMPTATSATPYQDEYRSVLAGFTPPPEVEHARKALKTYEDRVAAGVTGELDRQEEAYKKLGIDPAKMFEEERARRREESRLSKEDYRKSEHLRWAQMFAKFGSTPGPVLRAALLSINETVPDLLDDKAKENAIQRDINKALYELDKAELQEKKGRVDEALKSHNEAAKTSASLSLQLGEMLFKAQSDKLSAVSRVAAEEIQAIGGKERAMIEGDFGLRREHVRGKYDVQARQAGSGGGSELKENKEINRALDAFDKRNQPVIVELEKQMLMLPEGHKMRTAAQARLDRINTERNELEARLTEQFKRGTVNPKEGREKPDSTAGLKPGQIVDGYKFKGGDPNDKKNWAKE